MPLRPGLSACATLAVGEQDTAVTWRSGDVPVLATPRVIGLAEEAAVHAIEHELADGTTTVGYRAQLDHLAPTGGGGTVRAEATLEPSQSRRLTFAIGGSNADW